MQDYRSRAQTELVQARQNLTAVSAECDAFRQKADQQATDLASNNSIIRDLQSDVRRASTNEKACLPLSSAACHVMAPQPLHICSICTGRLQRDLKPLLWIWQWAVIPGFRENCVLLPQSCCPVVR